MSGHYEAYERTHGVKAETVMMRVAGLLSSAGVSFATCFRVGMAMKYALRCGLKDSWEKDAYKCADFICKALEGKWLHEKMGDENDSDVCDDDSDLGNSDYCAFDCFD